MKRWNVLFMAAIVAAVFLSYLGYKLGSEKILEKKTETLKGVILEIEEALEGDLSSALSKINSVDFEPVHATDTEVRPKLQELLDALGADDVYCVLPDGKAIYTYELPFALPLIDERAEDWYKRVMGLKPGWILVFDWKEVHGEYVADLAFRVRDLAFRVSGYPLKAFSKSLFSNDRVRLALVALTAGGEKKALVLASNLYKSGSVIEAAHVIPVHLKGIVFLDGDPAVFGEINRAWITQERRRIRIFWGNFGLALVLGIASLWIFVFFQRYKMILQAPFTLTMSQQVFSSSIAVLASFAVFSLLIFALGRSPFEAIEEMISWAFFTKEGIAETLIRSVPITIIAAGLCIAFEAGMWNIGGEGQFILGAITTTGFSVFLLKGVSPPVVLIVTFLAAALAGALWALGPALMKVKLGVSEILSTLMLNYVAIKLLDYLVYGPWKSAKVKNFPLTDPVPMTLGKIGVVEAHWGVLAIPAVALLVWFLMRKSVWGFEWKAVGLGPEAARQSGMPVQSSRLLALVLSGGIAGLAGAIHMFGAQYVLQHGFSPGYGYTAIIVAFIANLNPLAVLIAGPLITGLFVGNARLELTMNFPVSVSFLVQGVILVSVILIRNLFLYRPKFARRGGT